MCNKRCILCLQNTVGVLFFLLDVTELNCSAGPCKKRSIIFPVQISLQCQWFLHKAFWFYFVLMLVLAVHDRSNLGVLSKFGWSSSPEFTYTLCICTQTWCNGFFFNYFLTLALRSPQVMMHILPNLKLNLLWDVRNW